MPKQRKYNENAIIYLPNDRSNEIYLIKDGKVKVTYNDIETGEEESIILGPNDFFGLVTALGNYKRDETVTVISPVNMIVFIPEEFELLASKNPNLIIKFLQHFSSYIRELGTKVNQILSQRSSRDPSIELFKIGEYYQTNRKFEQAVYAYTRYTEYYSGGKLVLKAKERIEECRKGIVLRPINSESDTDDISDTKKHDSSTELKVETNDENKDKTVLENLYSAAKSLLGEKKYKDALKVFNEIENHSSYKKYLEFSEKIGSEIGLCYLELKDYNKSIRILTDFVKKFPKSKEIKHILFYIGRGYEGLTKKDKAKGFYKKIISMKPENDHISIEAKKRLELLS